MSRVFAARLRGVGGFEKRLVVKQIRPELARDPRFVSMFVDEANTLVQMSHPHIAPVFELGVVDGVYFLAMEYVDGATLAQVLESGPLAPGLAAHLGAQICDALHYAHTRFDVVHRDVTPRNVIVDANGHSRLLDFGIAAPLSEKEGPVFGTPGYLSPEQLAGRAEPASDVFALGAVLFEALTGRRAFDARTLADNEAALAAVGPAFNPDDGVDADLESIVLRALERERHHRFRSAQEFGRALRAWLARHHPEGVGPELGLRAERAEANPRRDVECGSNEEAFTPATREVRTLATSPLLDALVTISESGSDEGTVPITRSIRTEASRTARPRARRPWLVAAAGVLSVLALAFGLFGTPDADEPTSRAQAAEPPPQPSTPLPEPVSEPPPAPPPVQAEPRQEPPAPAPRPNAYLTVNASPWAELELDGRPLGRTPQRRIPVRAGRHTIVLRCPPLGREVRHTFRAEPGQPLVLVADLTSDPPIVRRR